MDDKISIIIPIYNVEKYLERCLKSVCEQTYQNLEIILVNDGSTDRCMEICNRYKADNRIIILTQNNKGLGAARNYGLTAVTGDYVGFIDSDDFIERTMFEQMLSAVKSKDFDFIECEYIEELDNSIQTEPSDDFIFPNTEVYSNEEVIENFLMQRMYNSCCLKMIKSSIVMLIPFSTIPRGEDAVYTWHLVQKARSYKHITKQLYHYNCSRKDNLTSKPFNLSKFYEIDLSKAIYRKINRNSRLYSAAVYYEYCACVKLITSYNKDLINNNIARDPAEKKIILENMREVMKKRILLKDRINQLYPSD